MRRIRFEVRLLNNSLIKNGIVFYITTLIVIELTDTLPTVYSQSFDSDKNHTAIETVGNRSSSSSTVSSLIIGSDIGRESAKNSSSNTEFEPGALTLNQPTNITNKSAAGAINKHANADLAIELDSIIEPEVSEDTVLNGRQTDEKTIEIELERDLNENENLKSILQVMWSILEPEEAKSDNRSVEGFNAFRQVFRDLSNGSNVRCKNEDDRGNKFYYLLRERSIATNDYKVGAISEVNEGREANDNNSKSSNENNNTYISSDSVSHNGNNKKSNIESLMRLFGSDETSVSGVDSGKIGNESLIMRLISVVEWNGGGGNSVGDTGDDNGIESSVVVESQSQSDDCENEDCIGDNYDNDTQEGRSKCDQIRGLLPMPSEVNFETERSRKANGNKLSANGIGSKADVNADRGQQVDGKQHQIGSSELLPSVPEGSIGSQQRRRRWHTKRALRSRPKIGFRKMARKITTTRVLVGAHLGSWAYRKFTNLTTSADATKTNDTSTDQSTNSTLIVSTVVVPLTDANDTSELTKPNGTVTDLSSAKVASQSTNATITKIKSDKT